MARISRRNTDHIQVAFEAISIEGGLLSPEWLSKISQIQVENQTAVDYKIPKGLTLRDEIGRYWRIAESLWGDFQDKIKDKPETKDETREFVINLLRQCFGFDDLKECECQKIDERTFPIEFECNAGKVPVVIGTPIESLDTLTPRFGEGHRKRTAFGLIQEYLNANDNALWGVVCDGDTFRIVRDNSSLTKPAWIQIDLKQIFQEQKYSDFAAFWLVAHRSRYGEPDKVAEESIIEKWKVSCRSVGTRARDQLRVGVEEALELLGQGFVSNRENSQLRSSLQNGTVQTQTYFQELLRLVYRLIFLLTVEERDLLHPTNTNEKLKSLYAEGYSLRRLRDRSVRRSAHDRFADLWESLKIVFKGLGQGESKLGLPALGGLFDSHQTPVLSELKIENGFLLQAIFKLCWIKSETGIARVNWRDMGPEELGSVYESLLELVPQISNGGNGFSFLRGDETRGNNRKLTGSYYTPDELVQKLLDTALEPVVFNTIKANYENPVKALLELTIIDPACGSAHFLLSAARRLAAHIAKLEIGGTPSVVDYRKALRKVISNCIYGVDRNPMALELARMALWLEAMTPDAPLSFLDHHLVCGDALLGLLDLEVMASGIPNEAFSIQSGDEKEICKFLSAENKKKLNELKRRITVEPISPTLFDLNNFNMIPLLKTIDAMPDDTPTAVSAKQIALENYLSATSNAGIAIAVDMYMCAFLAPKNSRTKNLIPTTDDILRAIRGTLPRIEVLRFIKDTVNKEKIFHWKLKFSHVFAKGGFDIVLGNPPWEKINFKDEEYFAQRFPMIANAPNKARRKDLLEQLMIENPTAYTEYETAKRFNDATSEYCRFGRRYPLTGLSRINLYSVFCETGVSILSKKGRLGFVIASGIATDDNNKLLLEELISKKRLIHTWDFENREGVFFPEVHRSFKFCLFVAGGNDTQNELADFAFYLTNIRQLSDTDRHFTLTIEELSLLNPNTKTCPTFRNRREAEITKYIYRRTPAWQLHEKTNNWPGIPKTPFNMSNDSGLFITLTARKLPENQGEDLVPLYESKFIHQFNHRFATFSEENQEGARDLSIAELKDPNKMIESRYWITRAKLNERFPGNWFLVFRDITQATNERTAIATILPEVACGNTLSILQNLGLPESISLVCILNSYIFDFCVRQKVSGTHLNHWIWHQLPIPANSSMKARCPWDGEFVNIESWIFPRVLELTFSANDISSYAKALGYNGPPFGWDEERRFLLRCELDAAMFHLYLPSKLDGAWQNPIDGTTENLELLKSNYATPRDAIDYIMDSFSITKSREIELHGQYRTKNQILEIYDLMIEAMRAGNPYKSKIAIPDISLPLSANDSDQGSGT